MALVQITPNHAIENKGILSIKHAGTDRILIKYANGNHEEVLLREISMQDLLAKLGRQPFMRSRRR